MPEAPKLAKLILIMRATNARAFKISFQSEGGKKRTRKTPNRDTFYAVL